MQFVLRFATIISCVFILFVMSFVILPDASAEEEGTKVRQRYYFEKYNRWEGIEARICRSNEADYLVARLYKHYKAGVTYYNDEDYHFDKERYDSGVFSGVEEYHFGIYPKPDEISAPLNAVEASGHTNWKPVDLQTMIELTMKDGVRESTTKDYYGRDYKFGGKEYKGASNGHTKFVFDGTFYNPTRECPQRYVPHLNYFDWDISNDTLLTDYCPDYQGIADDSEVWSFRDNPRLGVMRPDTDVLLAAKIINPVPESVPYCREVSRRLEKGLPAKAPTKEKTAESTGGLTLTNNYQCSNGAWFPSKAERDECEKEVMLKKEQERLRAEEAEAARKKKEADAREKADKEKRRRLADKDRACAELVAKTGHPCHPACSGRPEFAGCGTVSQ